MTSPVSAVEAIEKAMEDVTPGPWEAIPEEGISNFRTSLYAEGYKGLLIAVGDQNGAHTADMRYIAACNPVAMREVLALARQAEALKRENAEKDARIAALEKVLAMALHTLGVNENAIDAIVTALTLDGGERASSRVRSHAQRFRHYDEGDANA